MKIGFVYALAAAVTWGLIYAIDQKILTKTTPINLIFINAIISVVILFPLVLFKSPFSDLLKSGKINLYLIILSSVLSLTASWFISWGIKFVGASAASLFEIAYPFFVVLFSFLLFGQTITWAFALGGLLMFIGAAIITRFS